MRQPQDRRGEGQSACIRQSCVAKQIADDVCGKYSTFEVVAGKELDRAEPLIILVLPVRFNGVFVGFIRSVSTNLDSGLNNSSFGQVMGTHVPRNVQLGGKITFWLENGLRCDIKHGGISSKPFKVETRPGWTMRRMANPRQGKE
jgi:hypothetical protein